MFEINSDSEKIVNEFIELRKDSNFYSIAKKIHFSFKKDLERYVYFYKVWRLTELNAPNVKDIDKRSKEFHLDHIIPVNYAYLHGIDFSVVGSIENLQIISMQENFKKGSLLTGKVKETFSFFNINYGSLQRLKRSTVELAKTKDCPLSTEKPLTSEEVLVGTGSFTAYPKGGDW